MQFTDLNAKLEQAITDNDTPAIHAALQRGAQINARGMHNVTPLEYAVGINHAEAVAVLIAAKADPNLKDDEGDTAVTLAVKAYKANPKLLEMVLDAGGDPNAKRPDGDPIITRFINDHNLEAITYLHSRGASIDADINERPIIFDAALTEDWDVVWHLIKLGAKTDTPRVRECMQFAFKGPEITPPDSPLYADKVRTYEYLKKQGLELTPPMGL